MSATDRSAHPSAPELTPEEQTAMRELWQVYEAHYEEVAEELTAWAATQRELRPLLEAASPELAVEESRRSRELMGRALLDGDWIPYLEHLRGQGATYAQLGVGFATWFDVVGGARRSLVPHLARASGGAPERFQAGLAALDRLLDIAMGAIGEAYLETKENLIEAHQAAIRELSTPVLPVREGLLILPVVGAIDTERARQITERLLQGIQAQRARVVVLDITGVPAVDSAVANHLLQTVQAARLMGARVVVTGLSSANAQTLVRIGVDVSGLNTVGDLRGGLEEADEMLGYRVIRASPEASDAGA